MIPKGYRVIEDHEIIKPEHIRWSIGAAYDYKVYSHWIGHCKTELKTSGFIAETTCVLERVGNYPEFYGWYPLGLDVRCGPGDKLVLIHNKKSIKNLMATPETGMGIGLHHDSMRALSETLLKPGTGEWCVYRRLSQVRPKRPMVRRALNAHFSAPLPLP